jgi:hypothetical protein
MLALTFNPEITPQPTVYHSILVSSQIRNRRASIISVKTAIIEEHWV